jgi:succinyl-CoA synthetase alpha subunit
MAILIGRETRVLCQGLTGRAATYHVARMIAYGTNVVGGVTPGKGGRRHLDVPIFDTVAEAAAATGANASILFVPPDRAADAMLEALAHSPTVLVGPNSQGVLAPGLAQLGVMATADARQGTVGIASRSASLTSEVVAQITRMGLGQSTTVGVGGDPVHGLDLKTCLALFLTDPDTRGIVLIGEIGGTEEEEAAELIERLKPDKPIVALVVGRHAPPERRMGHAGAFATPGQGSAAAKIERLAAAGAHVARNASLVGATLRQAMTGA